MANASLNIPITGDASALIAEVNRAAAQLKKIQEEFNNAFSTKGKKLKVEIEQPPAGSIAALKKELAELTAKKELIQPFRIEHLSDVSNRIISIKDEIKRIQNIGVEVKPISPVLENSIAGLQEKLNKLRNAQINIDVVNEKEIARTNDEIIKLEQEIQRLKGLSIDPNGKLTQSSAKARQAITSLSLVAQDLPFGFIAIQNNLPAVLQTFTELKSKNDGLKGAFKELGGALVGPAGIFLAFSAITGAITYAVKEYGSLGNAIKVLLSENGALTKAQLDFAKETNKASAGLVVEDSKIRTLTKALLDSSTPRKEQIAYYEELKKISPDVVSGIDKENLGTDEANKLLSQNILLRAELVRLQIQEDGIKAIAKKNAEALAAARDEEAVAQKNLTNATNEYNLVSRNSGQNPLAAKGAATLAAAASSALDAARAKIADLTKVQDRYLGQLDPITLRVAEINGKFKEQSDYLEELRKKQQALLKGDLKFSLKIDAQDLDEAFNLDRIKSNVEKYGNALIDINNTEKERKNALKELIEINPEYFKGFDLNKNRVDELRESLESYIRTLLIEKKARQDAAAASKINIDLRKNEEKGIKSLGDKYNYFADSQLSIPDNIEDATKLSMAWNEFGNSTDKAIKANNKLLESLKFGQEVIDILTKGLNLKQTYDKAVEDLLNFSEYSQKEIEKIAKSFRFLQEPLEGLFNTLLEDGKVSWKSFADDVIKQIKRIAAALLSKAIIQGIANILAPGSGAIVSAGLKGVDTNSLLDYINGNDWVDLIPKSGSGGAANFNRVRGDRAMAMSGQVNMVLRGSDLVGAMNRTNSTINRVG